MSPSVLTLATGVLFLIAGFSVIGREIFFGPKVRTHETAPEYVRLSMLPLAAWAIYSGFAQIHGVDAVPPHYVHFRAFGIAGLLALSEVVQLGWLVSRFLPIDCRARLDRYKAHVYRLARCPQPG